LTGWQFATGTFNSSKCDKAHGDGLVPDFVNSDLLFLLHVIRVLEFGDYFFQTGFCFSRLSLRFMGLSEHRASFRREKSRF
jgi:hypothetical protein